MLYGALVAKYWHYPHGGVVSFFPKLRQRPLGTCDLVLEFVDNFRGDIARAREVELHGSVF